MATISACLTDKEIQTPANIDVDVAVKLFDKHCFISKWREVNGDYSYKLCRFGKGLRDQIKWVIHPKDALEIIDRLKMIEEKSSILKNGSSYYLPNH